MSDYYPFCTCGVCGKYDRRKVGFGGRMFMDDETGEMTPWMCPACSEDYLNRTGKIIIPMDHAIGTSYDHHDYLSEEDSDEDDEVGVPYDYDFMVEYSKALDESIRKEWENYNQEKPGSQ